jgi:hypothetical protein
MIQQDEDRNYNGKIDARYYFQDDQVKRQERVAEMKPTGQAALFSSTQLELSRTVEGHGGGLEKEKKVVDTIQKPVSDMRVQ